ncbi:helix-hairpin-helix domain-containing protein [Gramella sp. KN1008]|uniref:ComEA family DNA-binding protein n=1 Tax=Gramella sp. KN1008 TaxID=2529298 RepID=UPI0010395A33|nr:helix-hairpin-helix domain-containing protein [Gramella sp. KN1008]TBW28357.1 helix-hairpin-helix domain-containing protein [Gramella sp. KN1008]
MKFLKSHFALSRSQQNGVFVLVGLIIIFQVILFFDFYPEDTSEPVPEAQIEAYAKQLDSLNSISPGKKDTLYPFNPNFITDFKGYELGMSVEEIDRILAYREKGKWINSTEEFQKVTGVSDSLMKVVGPSFRFPEWVRGRPAAPTNFSKSTSETVALADLNSATAEDLKTVNGIGDVLSKRIVKYRQSIGGFRSHIQLNDVYGLSPEVVGNILQRFEIQTAPDIKLKNINTIGVDEMSDLPYFNYDLAQKVITYRRLNEGITSFEELIKIEGFPSDKIDRIKLYLALQ